MGSVRPFKPDHLEERHMQDLRSEESKVSVKHCDLKRLDKRVMRSLIHLVGAHHGLHRYVCRNRQVVRPDSLLLHLSRWDRASAILVPDDMAALDEPAQLVVRSLVVLIHRLEPGNLLAHLFGGGDLLPVRLLSLSLSLLVSVDLGLRAPAL